MNQIHYPPLKRRTQYPKRSNYTHYRGEIRLDCQYRCVYCDIEEVWLGGADAMQLDHYRPRSLFQDLEHDPNNLVWVCGRCNILKKHDWHPIDPITIHTVSKGYLDPFAVDRSEFFRIEDDGCITPLSGPAKYMIGKLFLDRQWLNNVRLLRQNLIRFNQSYTRSSEKDLEEAKDFYERGIISEKIYKKKVRKIQLLRGILQDILIQYMPQE